MRLFLPFLFFCLFTNCQSSIPNDSGWQLVYKNDANGKTVFGNKAKLLDAVRLGYPVRIGWGSNRVEHVADAHFLTIFDGQEVFAQIKPIIGQRPQANGDSLKIAFRANNEWLKMAGTNGYTTALMTDYLQDTIVGNNERYTATTWYVNYPANPNHGVAKPLWRAEAPLLEKWEAREKSNN